MSIGLKKYGVLVGILFMLGEPGYAQQNRLVDSDSQAKFIAEWLGVDVEGTLRGFTGEILFDSSDLASADFRVSVDANTAHTGNATIDKHLRKEQLLHTTKYPTMSFVSSRVSKYGSGFLVSGILTIKGISKPVSFPFYAAVEEHELVFNGNFRIDREDFDIGGGIVIGKAVDVALKVKVR